MKSLALNNKLSLIELENRKAIIGEINLPFYGIFGTCYSQQKDFVEKLCSQTSSKFYNTDTVAHKFGQWTVDIVLSALNALPNTKAWQTPANSIADVHWKWDVILEHEGCLYPIQIKSSLNAIEECQEMFIANLENTIDNIYERMEFRLDKYDNMIERYNMSEYDFASKKDAKLLEVIKEKNEKKQKFKIELENCKKAQPLYVWASRDEDTVQNLTNIFTELFSIQGSFKELQNKVISNYKTVKEILIEEETEKINNFEEISLCLRKYCQSKLEIFNQPRKINQGVTDLVRLEDILSHKIANNALKIVEDGLNYSKRFLGKINTISAGNIIVETKTKLEIIKSKIRRRIEQEIKQEIFRANIIRASKIRRHRRSQSYNYNNFAEEELTPTQKLNNFNITEFSKKLEKLIYFDSITSSETINLCIKQIEKMKSSTNKKNIEGMKEYDYQPE